MGLLTRHTALLLFLLRSFAPSVASSSALVSECTTKLPMSLSMVVSDLEAEGVAKVTTACLITSRSVTRSQRTSLVQSLFGVEESEEELATITAFGKKIFDDDADGIAICNPPGQAEANEVASTAVACGGTIVYAPSPVDLARGEGLFDFLAPAMERVIKSHEGTSRKAVLVVVVTGDIETAKSQMNQAATSILSTIAQPASAKKALGLEDVFDHVAYIASSTDFETFEDTLCHLGGACDPDEAKASVASTVAADFSLERAVSAMKTATVSSAEDLAAARQLGPAKQKILVAGLEKVKELTTNDAGEPQLVANFGDLCDASCKLAMEELDEMESPSSALSKQIKSSLKEELYAELGDICNKQLEQCELAAFEEFRRKLSQLRVSPNLASDMDRCASEALAEFSTNAKKLQAKGASWSVAPSKITLEKTLKEYCADRLVVAQASGQYKPVPRKGVTVGLHWLLPKPFGNDFRQEPWTVHTSDNLVYVPKDKITDVSPEEVQAGDWRTKVVPSPAGNDFVYVQ
mmetsp:Transcript_25244/g.35382  ORF Transcript_25244/g.35382 Transcript_25244/m.35382 type:complete len:521 (+) Transcript_25244:107-1669(+)